MPLDIDQMLPDADVVARVILPAMLSRSRASPARKAIRGDAASSLAARACSPVRENADMRRPYSQNPGVIAWNGSCTCCPIRRSALELHRIIQPLPRNRFTQYGDPEPATVSPPAEADATAMPTPSSSTTRMGVSGGTSNPAICAIFGAGCPTHLGLTDPAQSERQPPQRVLLRLHCKNTAFRALSPASRHARAAALPPPPPVHFRGTPTLKSVTTSLPRLRRSRRRERRPCARGITGTYFPVLRRTPGFPLRCAPLSRSRGRRSSRNPFVRCAHAASARWLLRAIGVMMHWMISSGAPASIAARCRTAAVSQVHCLALGCGLRTTALPAFREIRLL